MAGGISFVGEGFCVHVLYVCVCVCVSSSPKPPSSLVAVVSGGEAYQDLSNLKMKVRSDVVQRPAKSSGRRAQVKILRPPAGSSVEDKEVRKDKISSHFQFSSF